MTFAIIAGVLVFWFVLICLVRLERGWVGVNDAQRAMIRMRVEFLALNEALGQALRPVVEIATARLVAFGEAMERAGLLEPCPYCGHPPLDHVGHSSTGCVVVIGSLPLRVAVAIPPTYEGRP